MSRLVTLLLVAAGLTLLQGCSGKGGRVEDFTPAEGNARTALETTLTHWQGGGPPGAIPGTTPKVEATDSRWKAGQKLKSYQILGEEPANGSGPRFFKVKLTPPTGAPVEVKYAVLGIDPLLIYREEDFQKLSGAGR